MTETTGGGDRERRSTTSAFDRPPDQLGCVVPDLDAAIAEWNAQGVGPFLTMKGAVLADYVYDSRASRPKLDVAFSQQGDLQIELIQPVGDEPSAYRDFLAGGGHGPHHHGWFCEDYTGDVIAARAEGRAELHQGRWGALHFVYFQPAPGDELIGELIEMNALSEQIFDLVRREAERWDGRTASRPMLAAAGWGLRMTAVRVQLGQLLGRG